MRKSQAVRIILAALAFLFSGYYLYHPERDLFKPELFWPDAGGQRPSPGSPMVAVEIRIDTKIADDSNNYSAVLASLDSWNGVGSSTASIVNGGTILLQGDYSPRWGDTDGYNTIELVTSNWTPAYPGYIAYTVLQYDVPTSKLIEADIFLNGDDYTFTDVYDLPKVDTQTIVTHELGHVLGLGHCQYLLPTMSSYEPPIATHKRTLRTDDEQGLRWLYAIDAGSVPGPSLWRMVRGACDQYFDYSTGPAVMDATTAQLGFCLIGAGFAGSNFTAQLVSERTGDVFTSPVSGVTFSTSNLVTLGIDLSQMPVDSYRLDLQQQDGKSGTLRQGLIVKQVGVGLPVADITPGETIVTLNKEIVLDGSGSTGTGGLNYSWFLLEGSSAGLTFSSQTGSTIRATAGSVGDYVVGLMVLDGSSNYSLIAHSVLSVKEGNGGGGGGGGGGGCQVQGGSICSTVVAVLFPLCFLLLLRLRRFLR